MNLILNLLKKIPLFQELTEEEHQSIIAHIELQYFPAKHLLFEEGALGSSLYILKTGSVRIFSHKGQIAILNEGSFFGEMALLEEKPRMASAETLSEAEIFVLKKEDLSELLKTSPSTAEKLKAAHEKRRNDNANNSLL